MLYIIIYERNCAVVAMLHGPTHGAFSAIAEHLVVIGGLGISVTVQCTGQTIVPGTFAAPMSV